MWDVGVSWTIAIILDDKLVMKVLRRFVGGCIGVISSNVEGVFTITARVARVHL